MATYTIGVDFGTLSARAVLVDTADGRVAARSEYIYPHGVMRELENGRKLPSDSAYAHPADYMTALRETICAVSAEVPKEEIVAIGIDATSCSMLPLGAGGAPLALSERFSSHPHAYIKLWKHHSAATQAVRLQEEAVRRGERFLSDLGGTVNAETFFPKLLETFEEDKAVFDAALCFVEVSEWLTLLLTGKLITAECAACFKRFYHPFRGYPAVDFFEAVQSGFGKALDKLKGKPISVGAPVGTLNEQMAEILGLDPSVTVVAPQVDAHSAMAAVGGKQGDFVMVMGTSGVSLLCSHSDTGMPGIYSTSAHCFFPDTYGHEAGLTSVGDTFSHFVDSFLPPEYHKAAAEQNLSLHDYLSDLARPLRAGQSGLLMLDWTNGARTPLMDYSLTGAVLGLTNRTRPEELYRAMLESVAFGTRRIKETFESHGHKISRIFCTGGIARKNKLFCQIMSDVLGADIMITAAEDACALGSAIGAAAALPDQKPEKTVERMAASISYRCYPDLRNRDTYALLYKEYLRFGETMSGYESVMKKVRAIQKEKK